MQSRSRLRDAAPHHCFVRRGRGRFVTTQVIDIFISYSHQERVSARALADALETHRWTIWWDERLRSGQPFHDLIDQALKAAKCIVVLWSPKSIESEYVQWEANRGYEDQKLIPVMIESVDLPNPFRQLHHWTVTPTDWTDLRSSASFHRIVGDIAARIGSPPTALGRVIASALDKRPDELSARDYPRVATLIVQDRPVRDITPLEKLVNLQVLVLDRTQVADVAPLAKLRRLQRLGLRSTLVTDVQPLGNLAELQELSLVNTRVDDLRPLANLRKLEQVHLRHSDVSDLEPVRGMSALRCLYLGGTPVTDLAPLGEVRTLDTAVRAGAVPGIVRPAASKIAACLP